MGIDPGDKFLQVFVHPYKPKNRESGEDTANCQEWMSAFEVEMRFNASEIKIK